MALVSILYLEVCPGMRRAWREATETNSTIAYREFLAQYPDSTHRAQAEDFLVGLFDGDPFVYAQHIIAGGFRRSDVTSVRRAKIMLTKLFPGSEQLERLTVLA
jgi:hypothetical protein